MTFEALVLGALAEVTVEPGFEDDAALELGLEEVVFALSADSGLSETELREKIEERRTQILRMTGQTDIP